ncbi:SOS response-associated peptidase family protein [Luteibacter sp. PPL201]|uniref:SOS response-associated peptidase family protein n=1 Tax=Luteibacter sahnii TaxID=3021977 RepID=A0ABT6B799_9GAMM|nr:SOS response-associated peptidase family protein [Luteibacter sp. PPL193]MDY1548098.1 SOS response-associated peptidase family protein [Luteibacter sp. PPL193]
MEACYELMPPWAVTRGTRGALRVLGIDAETALGAYGVFPRIEPGSYAPVVCSVDGCVSLHGKRWGMLPGWSTRPELAYRTAFVEARLAPSRPAYREAFVARRCLIPATGMYVMGMKGEVSESLLARPVRDRLLCMAGLWNLSGDGVFSYSVLVRHLTTSREPVIVSPTSWEAWLHGDVDVAQAIVDQALTPELRYYASSYRVPVPSRIWANDHA